MDINQPIHLYLSNEETYESGEIIIEEGTKDNWVYIILEGQAKVTKRTDAGIIRVDKLKKGAIFGEMALLGKVQGGRSEFVIAADGAIRVGVLNLQQLLRDYESLSPDLRSLITTLILKLEESNEKIVAFVAAANQKDSAEV